MALFSNLKDTNFETSSKNYLNPYEIHKVNLTRIEPSTLENKDKTKSYSIIQIEFTNPETKGVYTHNLFIPSTKEEMERGSNPKTGKPSPSSFERYQFTLMQLVQILNPEGAQKIKDNADKIDSIETFNSLILKALTNKNKTDFYLKLVSRSGSIYATLPGTCYIDKENNAQALSFVSSDPSRLNFSAYELEQAKKYQSATPTNMDNLDIDSKKEELDWSDISLD